MKATGIKAVPAAEETQPLGHMLLDIADQVNTAQYRAKDLIEFALDLVIADKATKEASRALVAVQLFAEDVARRLDAIERALKAAREASSSRGAA